MKNESEKANRFLKILLVILAAAFILQPFALKLINKVKDAVVQHKLRRMYIKKVNERSAADRVLIRKEFGLQPPERYITGESEDVERFKGGPGRIPSHSGAYVVRKFRDTNKRFSSKPSDGFMDTKKDSLSTFATDVDTASYVQARSYLNINRVPPKALVRAEEFINSFPYHYPAPRQYALKIHAEGVPSPFDDDVRILRIGLKARKGRPGRRRNAVVTFVVDASPSMDASNKMPLVKRSMKIMAGRLRQGDSVGIVTYSDVARIHLRHTDLSQKHVIFNAIDNIRISGCTNLESGVRTGYKLASKGYRGGCINRIFILSDGMANQGVTDPDVLVKLVKKKKADGISLSAIGFGLGDYNDRLMEKLGNKGDGYHAYVNNYGDAYRIFDENLLSSLEVVARDVKVQVRFNPSVVRKYRLIGYENRDVADHKFRDDTVDGGEIGPGHEVTALYELKIPKAYSHFKEMVGVRRIALVTVRYRNPKSGRIRELTRPVTGGMFRKSIYEAEDSTRIAISAAAFADILKNPALASPARIKKLRDTLTSVSPGLRKRKDVAELVNFIKVPSLAGR